MLQKPFNVKRNALFFEHERLERAVTDLALSDLFAVNDAYLSPPLDMRLFLRENSTKRHTASDRGLAMHRSDIDERKLAVVKPDCLGVIVVDEDERNRGAGGEMTRGCGGVGDGLEVWKDSENSRRHSSAPRARNEEGRRDREKENERASEREGRSSPVHGKRGSAREESQVPNRRGNETPGTNNKQANKNRHPPSLRRLPARGALGVTIFEFSGLSETPPLRGMQWREAKRMRGCQLHVMLLNPRSDDRLHQILGWKKLERSGFVRRTPTFTDVIRSDRSDLYSVEERESQKREGDSRSSGLTGVV
ncbi:hypothetical protein DBV15_04186 [Temnothorax longispinosus]|uniref:Uncharacterized protein n=1 Tax=Temnothorax longispinosus TaxID=300112 RepID=A0A4S2KHG8_9HYME|nr:hypothetical protein DBV15_04186 [Temnothorax longispinosus]